MTGTSQIFISYASRDRTHARRLQRTLSQWGLQPWMDQQRLAGGQQWSGELQRAIAQSAALLLVLTPAALASEMVRREYHEALAQRIPVLLLMRRPVARLPDELADLPRIRWQRRQWRSDEEVFLALHDLGIRPAEQSRVLGSQWPVDLILSDQGRGAPGWQRFTVDQRTYTALIYGTASGAALLVVTLFAGDAAALLNGGRAPAMFTGLVGILGPIVLLLAMMSAIYLLTLQAIAFVAYRFQWWPPEVVLVTDAGVSTNLFRLRWARTAFAPLHYPFAAVATLERRRTLFGAVVLTLRPRDGAAAGRSGSRAA